MNTTKESQSTVSYVPYQCCPVCNGHGQVLADGYVSSVYQTCKVCNGARIIPMHVLSIHQEPKPTMNDQPKENKDERILVESDISVRLHNAIMLYKTEGIRRGWVEPEQELRLSDFSKMLSINNLLRIRNFGKKSLAELKTYLTKKGFSYNDK